MNIENYYSNNTDELIYPYLLKNRVLNADQLSRIDQIYKENEVKMQHSSIPMYNRISIAAHEFPEIQGKIVNLICQYLSLNAFNTSLFDFNDCFSWSGMIVKKKDSGYLFFVIDPQIVINQFNHIYPIVVLSPKSWYSLRGKMPPIAATMEDIHQLMEDYAKKTNTSYSRNTYNTYKKQIIESPEKWLGLMRADRFHPLPFRHQYSKEEFFEIKKGFLGDMDTKWLIVFDESVKVLYFYHIGQEALIAKVTFDKEDDLYVTEFLQIAEYSSENNYKNWLGRYSEATLTDKFSKIIQNFLLTNG